MKFPKQIKNFRPKKNSHETTEISGHDSTHIIKAVSLTVKRKLAWGGGTCTSEGNYKMSEVITKQKILIADDSEMNRELLAAILEEEYDIIQVNDGVQAVDCLQRQAEEISLLLLDIVMPHMDGFEVLSYMNKEHWIDAIPVVIISSENSPIYIKRGYDLGATDFIGKPFDANMVLRRSANAILLGAKQRRMTSIVSNQIYEREKSSKLMINILSHIVEFRNGESGLHVLHIQTITEMLLRQLVQKENNRYALSKEQIRMITTASALHDIGKISIPDEILNKPGRLTAEEFAVIKGHSMAGANMLSELPLDQKEEPLVKTAYEICRWHHERYDGGGYPDGLKGEEIPVSAQVVALADVYDALTSERCYKDAYSHEKAIEMILAGQCGAFNPLMLECLLDISSSLKKKWAINPRKGMNRQTFLILLADFTILRWIPQRKLCSNWNLRECAIISWRRAAEILFLLIPFHRRYSPLTRLAVNEAGLQNLHFLHCRAVC